MNASESVVAAITNDGGRAMILVDTLAAATSGGRLTARTAENLLSFGSHDELNFL